MRWQLFAPRGFSYLAERARRITWSVAHGALVVIVPAGVAYGPMDAGGGGPRRRRGARPAKPAAAVRAASAARAAEPER